MEEEFLITMCEKTEGYGIKSITQSIPKDAYIAISVFLTGKATIVPNPEQAPATADVEADKTD